MKQKKMLLIVNPKAGKGNIKRKLPRIIKNFLRSRLFNRNLLYQTRLQVK